MICTYILIRLLRKSRPFIKLNIKGISYSWGSPHIVLTEFSKNIPRISLLCKYVFSKLVWCAFHWFVSGSLLCFDRSHLISLRISKNVLFFPPFGFSKFVPTFWFFEIRNEMRWLLSKRRRLPLANQWREHRTKIKVKTWYVHIIKIASKK